jgi:hypothetical protein
MIFVIPTNDATTTPDSASILRASIITHPPRRPRCAMSSRLTGIDALETTPLHLKNIHWSLGMMRTSMIDAPKG